jgi:hypothetical protein
MYAIFPAHLTLLDLIILIVIVAQIMKLRIT